MPIPAFLFIPLLNFHSNVTPIGFGKFFKLTKLSDQESALLQGPLRIGKASTISLVQTRFKLEAQFEIEGDVYKVPPQMFSELGDILTSMRLTHAGDVGVLHVFTGYTDKDGNKIHGMINAQSEWEAVDPGGLYILNENVLPRINGIFNLLQRKGPNLSAALRRFSAAYLHKPGEDRILDFTIALESTLLFGIREELAFRLALAAAVLLAPEENPNRTFEFLQIIYKLRSAIVHDGKSLEDLAAKFKGPVERVTEQPYADVSYVLAQYTRAVLVKVLGAIAAGKSLKQVNEELVRKVIAGAR